MSHADPADSSSSRLATFAHAFVGAIIVGGTLFILNAIRVAALHGVLLNGGAR